MHAHRKRQIRCAVVAELSKPVVSPGVDVSIAACSQRMIVCCTHLCGLQPFACVIGVGGVVHAHRNRIRIGATGVVAELAIAVGSPSVCISIAACSQ